MDLNKMHVYMYGGVGYIFECVCADPGLILEVVIRVVGGFLR